MASVSAFAVENWVMLVVEPSKGDTSPGDASLEYYEAYYCTTAAAEKMFGSSDVNDVAAYLKDNYDTGWAALKESGTLLNQEEYGFGLYSFTQFMSESPKEGTYLALVSYQNGSKDAGSAEVDVLGGSASGSGSMAFNGTDPSTPQSGWTGTVPEPTSGLLSLFALAALALKRKRVVSC